MDEDLHSWTRRFNQIQLRLQTSIKLNSLEVADSEKSFNEFENEAALLRKRVEKALKLSLLRNSSQLAPLVLPEDSGDNTKRSGQESSFVHPYKRLSSSV